MVSVRSSMDSPISELRYIGNAIIDIRNTEVVIHIFFFFDNTWEVNSQYIKTIAMSISPIRALPDRVRSNVNTTNMHHLHFIFLKANNSTIKSGNKNWTNIAGSLKNELERSASFILAINKETSTPRELGKNDTTPGILIPVISKDNS